MTTQVGTYARSGLPSWLCPAAVLVLVVTGTSIAAVSTTWVQMFAVWPFGLATGAVVAARPRLRPLVALLGGAVAAGSVALLDVPALSVAMLGVATAVMAMTSSLLLGAGFRRGPQPALETLVDLRRWLLAGTVGPALGMALLVGTLSAAGLAIRPTAVVLAFLSTALSNLVLTPVFLRIPHRPLRVDASERWAQWSLVVAVSAAVLMLQSDVAWAFALVPLYAWGALRLTLREMVAQLVGTTAAVLAAAMLGLGPFALTLDDSTAALLDATQLQLFLLSGVLLVVPYTLVAQQLRLRSAEAHQERELVGRIMDSASRTAIVALDRTGRITSFNVGAETLLGYRAEEVLGQQMDVLVPRAELLAQAEAAGTASEFHRVARARTLSTAEPRDWRMRRKSGEVRTHSMAITPMSDERGTVVGYVCTSEDVTARVQRQDALLAALLSEREAVERLEQADRMKDALVSTVSHELRTPLTSILGYSTMLVDGDLAELPPIAVQTLERILSNGERLRSLVEDLLVLSRVNAGALDLASEPLDLRDVVTSAYDVVAPSLAERDLDVRVELCPDKALVDGDASMLERVVLNLLTNALKFTPDGGRVDVSVTLATDEVVLEVSDTGLGIPVDEQDQLFTQFFRSSIAKKEAIQGTGLGLSIARAIVDQHGGVIGATSEESIGTTFLVVLPRLEVAAGSRHRQVG